MELSNYLSEVGMILERELAKKGIEPSELNEADFIALFDAATNSSNALDAEIDYLTTQQELPNDTL